MRHLLSPLLLYTGKTRPNCVYRGFGVIKASPRTYARKANKMTTNSQEDVARILFKQILSEEATNSNMVFSPLSIHVCLAMAAVGSSGKTLDQVMDFLKVTSIDELNSFASKLFASVLSPGSCSNAPKVSSANGIWIEQSSTIQPSFKHAMQEFYKANIEPADFREKVREAEKRINSWVEKKTNGRIMNIIPPKTLDPLTRVVLANCLHFMGAWRITFEKFMTRDDEFHLHNGKTIKVPFMRSSYNQAIGIFDQFKILKLPYEYYGDKSPRRFSMYFLLPNERDGLPKLLEKATSEAGFLDSHLPTKYVEVKVIAIPKFEISFSMEASRVLKSLGLTLPFQDDSTGGLTEMVNSKLLISKILHKCAIKVNEQGCEASAATVGAFFGGCRMLYEPKPKIEFVADHPFMFLIREDDTGTILFMGQVLDPSIGV